MPSSIMRNVDTHLLGEKIDEAVTHFINSHPTAEVDANSLSLNVQDDNVRVLTVMHVDQHSYSPQVCRQVTVGEQVSGQWGEELMDTEERIAALVAHLQQTRPQHTTTHHKVQTTRSDDATVILDTPMRLYNGQTLDHQSEIEVTLPPMPSLQNMKRCQDANWFNKGKDTIKNEPPIISDSDHGLELAAGSPAPHKQNKKSLPHKKRISKKLKRNPENTSPQVEDIVVITNCNDNEVPQEEILPDSFVPHQQSLHSITHEVRPIFICQLCGDFYGEEQFKFFQHLKQHYEPHSTIIIENPVSDLGIDKMTNTCVVDNNAALPDAIVELSLENTVPKTIYQTIDKHILYTSSDKTLNYSSNKAQYSMATIEKNSVLPNDSDKSDLYESLDKLEVFPCGKCTRQFRKQKHCEQHMKEAHSSKGEEMIEFSDPEDLMEGIHVTVSEEQQLCAHYDHSLLPHLTVDNGHVHQTHAQWHNNRSNSNSLQCGEENGYCTVFSNRDTSQSPQQLKEEVFQRIFDTDVTADNAGYQDAVIENNIHTSREAPPGPPTPPPAPSHAPRAAPTPAVPAPRAVPAGPTDAPPGGGKKRRREFVCIVCGRVFEHRNSLFYHMLSHEGKQKECKECGKSFYTAASLKIHKRVHNGDRPYKCDQCEKEFKQISDLKYHKNSIHSNLKNHKCDYCGKEFARKYSLNLHRKIHTGERNFKCDFCSKTFRASSYLKSHMRSHTGDKPYKCAECDRAFRVASDLRRHIRTHEKYKTQLANKPVQKITQTKPEEKTKTELVSEAKKVSLSSIMKIDEESKKTIIKVQNKTPKDKKPSKAAKKNQIKKGAAPNVTVTNKLPNDPQFKMADEYNTIEVYDSKIEYKIKDYYEITDQNQYKSKEQMFSEPYLVTLKEIERINSDRDLLRTYKSESEMKDNTDGKMHVLTHVKPSTMTSSQINMSEIKNFERDVITREVRTEGDHMETGFLEKLLYNIPAV